MAAGMCSSGYCHTALPLEQPLAAIMGDHPYASVPNNVVWLQSGNISSYCFLIINVIALKELLAEGHGVGLDAGCLSEFFQPVSCPLIKISRMEGTTQFE